MVKKSYIEDPSIVGLGNLIIKDVERIQPKAGRLDLLLSDQDDEKRYEIEIMLGSIDESHIIRAVKYWDIERKRFPNYEHYAVVIAEDITSRFLNIISLFNSTIPLSLNDMDTQKVILEEKDIEIVPSDKKSGRLKFRITKSDVDNNRETLKHILKTSYTEWKE